MKHETITAPKFLLPQCDHSKWAVVACDQFSAQHSYWRQLEQFVGDAPSALKIVFPEVYLDGEREGRIASINATMKKYLADGLFVEREGFVLVERTFHGATRAGLLVAIDLDRYDWRRVRTEIRATEDTIEDRLPIRVEIRRGASIESPHILIVADDAKKTIVEPLFARRTQFEKLYDFTLNMGGGHLTGYLVPSDETDKVKQAFRALLDPDLQIAKYGFDAGVMLAVGDGNHSLATAKVHWENLKKTLTHDEAATHPARYALVEVVNIYGDGMNFMPIHRILYGKDKAELVAGLKKHLDDDYGRLVEVEKNIYKLETQLKSSVAIKKIETAVAALKAEGAIPEYVHGEEHVRSSVAEVDGIGVFMPEFPKSELFDYMVNVGNLPKKAFSIGEAEFKKYYMECRKIIN